MRHVLYIIAVVDSVFLGVCGCLLLFPAGRSSLAGVDFSRRHISDSESFAPASAIPDQTGLAGASFQETVVAPAEYDAAAPGDHPASRAHGTTTVVAASVSGDIDPAGYDRDQHYVSAANRLPDVQPANLSTSSARRADSDAPYAYVQPSVASSAYGRNSEPPSPDAADAASQASVPVAFTTSPEGATPPQAAALNRLQNEFADQVAASGQDPAGAGYEEAWDAAEGLSDSNYAQQFGWQAFVEAQLAQFHGGAN